MIYGLNKPILYGGQFVTNYVDVEVIACKKVDKYILIGYKDGENIKIFPVERYKIMGEDDTINYSISLFEKSGVTAKEIFEKVKEYEMR